MNTRKTWLRRIGISLLLLVLILGATGLVLYQRMGQVPDWYEQAQTLADDPKVEERTAIKLQSWANQVSAGDPQSKTANDRQFTVVLTAADINRLIAKWSKSSGFESRINQYLQDVRVRIADGKITIAGKATDYDKVMSMVLEPQHDDTGNVQLKIDRILAGEQPMMLVMLNSQQITLSGAAAKRAKAVADRIKIDERSIASGETAELYATALLAELLSGRPADAYAFVNRISGFTSDDPLASRVKAIDIRDGELTLTLETLGAAERDKLVARLKSIADTARPQ